MAMANESSANRPLTVRLINYGIQNHKRVKMEGPTIFEGKVDPEMNFEAVAKAVAEGRAEVELGPAPSAKPPDGAAKPKGKQG